MSAKNEVSARFLAAYECLLEQNSVSDKKEFATIIGVSPSMITEISKGRSAVGVTAIQNIVKCYHISGDWLLIGEGPMLREASPKADMPKVEASVQTKTGKTKASASAPGTADSAFFMDYIRTKDTMIEQKSQEIASLTGKVARLEAECAFLREQLSRLQD